MGKGELSERDLRAILAFLRANYAFQDHEAYVQTVVHGIRDVIRSDLTSYCEIDPVRQTSVNWLDRPEVDTPEAQRIFAARMFEIPLVAHYVNTGDGRALRITDFLSQRQFRETGVYSEHYRPKDVEYVLAAWLPAPNLAIPIGLHRKGLEYTDRERLILELLRTHLIQGWRNAQVVSALNAQVDLGRALSHLHDDVVVLSAGGTATFIGERAQELLDRHLGRASPLPDLVVRWTRSITAALSPDADDVPAPAHPFTHESASGRLVIHASGHGSELVLSVHEVHTRPPRREATPTLTRREREILAWVAEGKTNQEIARILHCATKTVEKHLEHIYDKLEVPNRAAAVAAAVASMAAPEQRTD